MSISNLTHDDEIEVSFIEELESKIAPDGGETVLPLHITILKR